MNMTGLTEWKRAAEKSIHEAEKGFSEQHRDRYADGPVANERKYLANPQN
jgi:hypothetical protein